MFLGEINRIFINNFRLMNQLVVSCVIFIPDRHIVYFQMNIGIALCVVYRIKRNGEEGNLFRRTSH